MNQIQEKWEEILFYFKDFFNISDTAFNTFIKPLSVNKVEDSTVYISSSADNNQLGVGFIENKYGDLLKVSVAEITKKEYNLVFCTTSDNSHTSNNFNITSNENYYNSNLSPQYTFDTFVVGGSNKFAYTAALAVSESPGKSYNPLYIYGGPGLGKTHLLHSIGNYILSQDPNKKILYVTSEAFTNEVIDSIRSSNNATSMSKLREKYRTVDVLMIDDIQFLIGKEATQEEFFYTFNTLHNAGKQIILTSDKLPREIETLETRIRTRFEWGLMADLGYPDYETRMAILLKKMENNNVYISEDILSYIANNIKSNVREIEGALNRLIAYHNLEKKEITMDIAVSELSNIIFPNTTKEITPQLIIEVVADHYNITIDQMCSKTRTSNIARPRQIAMYLCKEMTDFPFQAIGELLGGKDHTTVIYGHRKISDDYNDDTYFKQEVDILKKKINPNL